MHYVLDLYNARGVISGMALGVDQDWAWVAVEMGLPFVAAIPCVNHEKHWPIRSQADYHRLLALAAKVIHVTKEPYRPELMQRRNEWMVNKCDVLFAAWNGTDGGTANCYRYAESVGKPIYRVLQVPTD
jgi:uncharacterized phage-like protein YoqJ